jgi:hypothetical protein
MHDAYCDWSTTFQQHDFSARIQCLEKTACKWVVMIRDILTMTMVTLDVMTEAAAATVTMMNCGTSSRCQGIMTAAAATAAAAGAAEAEAAMKTM